MREALECRDSVGFALVGDVDIDLRRADVDVAGESADDLHGDAVFGEHCAERMSESVGGAAIVAHGGGGGVLGDDVADRASGEWFGDRGASGAQADKERVCRGRGPAGVPPRTASSASACSGTVRVRRVWSL